MNSVELKKKLESTVDFLESELNQIRTGRASPKLLEDIPVRAYDSMLTIKEVGTISVPDSSLLVVSPWDKSLLAAIAKAVRESDLHLNPAVGDETVRVPVPPLTEERRKEFVKLVSTKVEAARQSVRNIRQDAMKAIETAFSAKTISEDEKFTQKENVEDIVKETIVKIDSVGDSKKNALMSI